MVRPVGKGRTVCSKSNFWPFIGSSLFSGISTLTLFLHTKSVEKKRERAERKERERGREGEEGEKERKEGGREEACVGSMVRMPKEERRL